MFSRSLRPGSIAARNPVKRTGTGIIGFPGLSGRAPLRLNYPGALDKSDRRFPGLSGRAPLRRLPHWDSHGECPVFPVSQAGLHCGDLATRSTPRRNRFSRSLRPGSIAANIPANDLLAGTGFPGLSGRAPLRRKWYFQWCPFSAMFSRSLRPGSIAAITRIMPLSLRCKFSRSLRPGSIAAYPYPGALGNRALVFPVSQAGLHCGDVHVRAELRLWQVFPVSQAGLHCGTPWSAAPKRTNRRFPGLSGRAPLRQRGPARGRA